MPVARLSLKQGTFDSINQVDGTKVDGAVLFKCGHVFPWRERVGSPHLLRCMSCSVLAPHISFFRRIFMYKRIALLACVVTLAACSSMSGRSSGTSGYGSGSGSSGSTSSSPDSYGGASGSSSLPGSSGATMPDSSGSSGTMGSGSNGATGTGGSSTFGVPSGTSGRPMPGPNSPNGGVLPPGDPSGK